MAGYLGNCIPYRSQSAGNSLAQRTALHFHWLVLVRWNARTFYRLGGGRGASTRGSVHLPATDRVVSADYLGHPRWAQIPFDAQVPLSAVSDLPAMSRPWSAQKPGPRS